MELNTLKINEIFCSIQGEGRNIGKPSIFVRTTGCNYRCDFCDTKYALDGKGKQYTVEQLIEECKKYNCNHIVFTGGEPLLQKDFSRFTHSFTMYTEGRYTLELETNGSIYDSNIPGQFKLINVSPKFQYYCLDYKRTLMKWSMFSDFKYVIQTTQDIELAKEISDECKPNHSIVMREGNTKKSQLDHMDWLIKNTKYIFPEAQIIPRLHCILYNGVRRK